MLLADRKQVADRWCEYWAEKFGGSIVPEPEFPNAFLEMEAVFPGEPPRTSTRSRWARRSSRCHAGRAR
eukprot:5608809-Alexandrium_andersonii.AAC.1